jgi:hypothetical protein
MGCFHADLVFLDRDVGQRVVHSKNPSVVIFRGVHSWRQGTIVYTDGQVLGES